MAKNTIKLKDYSHVVEEYTAAGAITPGMLVEVDSTNEVQAHSGVDGHAVPMFATEDEFFGKTINDAYAADDKVQVWIPQRGDMVYALLADGEEVVIGDKLTSNGDGALKVYEADASDVTYGAIIAEAVEAVDNSSSGSTIPDKRIIVRIV